tara:strand:- start:362 stop:577 length:216 start_codon:yes stop_codon:yes gene_type:complete
MTRENFDKKKAVLTFDGKNYIMEDLSEEIKEMIKNLQIADAQLKMHEDTLKLLSRGKNSIVNDIRDKLEEL